MILILALLCFATKSTVGQDSTKLIDMRYHGGEAALREFLIKNIHPVDVTKNNSIGFSISGITITSQGHIADVSIINSLDNKIDQQVINVLKDTQKDWIKTSGTSDITFYVQIYFTISRYPVQLEFDYPVANDYNFIKPIISSASATSDDQLPVPNRTVLEESINSYKNHDYQTALDLINEMIRREPYNKNHYQFRMLVARKLGNKELMVEDTNKLTNFIPGASLDELMTE